jgi:3'-5' exoribonuclease 1
LIQPELNLFGIREFQKTAHALLLDLEFACWEGSLKEGWPDPARPPEVIEIGGVAYDLDAEKSLASFTTFVRPRLNPVLSAYCRSLVHVSQREIDGALPLPEALKQLAEWETQLRVPSLPTCSWGVNDRLFLARDACRQDCADPFAARPHIDLRPLVGLTAGFSSNATPDRDEVRRVLSLSPNLDRHRALADALDLGQFCRIVKRQQIAAKEDGESDS